MNEQAPDSVVQDIADRPLSSDPYRSFTLPSRYYLDPGIFEQEKPAIFYKSWHYVAHENSLLSPGDYASAVIGDEKVFVIRGRDGELRAFYNVCRHRAHHLVEGRGRKNAIVCPYHSWCYDLDGSLVSAPMTQDLPVFVKEQSGLVPIAIDVLSGLVLVNLDSQAPDIDTFMPGLREDLQQKAPWLASGKAVRDGLFGDASMRANWKVVVDNFVECYHCRAAHPAFADMINMDTYEHTVFENWARQLGPDTKPESSAYHFDESTTVPGAMFWYLWPNLTINIAPGYQIANVLSINPIDVEHTSFSGQVISAETSEVPERVFDYVYDELGAEDQALCESVHQGLKSKSYNQGPFVVDSQKSGMAEHALHDFHRRVLAALDAV